MSKIEWLNTLGWTKDHLDDIRYVGYAYLRQGKYDIALNFFETLVILDPDNAYDLQTLGALHLQINQPDKAVKYLERSLSIEGDHSPTLLNLAKAFFMLGKKDEGLRLANLLKSDPTPFVANTAKALILAYS